MTDSPGFFSKFLAILGVAAYALAALFGVFIIDLYLETPSSFEEGLGNIIGTIIFLVYNLVLTFFGSLFLLAGQIWRQVKIIVYLSTTLLVIIILPIILLTISALDGTPPDPGLFVVWGFYILMLVVHIQGIRNQS